MWKAVNWVIVIHEGWPGFNLRWLCNWTTCPYPLLVLPNQKWTSSWIMMRSISDFVIPVVVKVRWPQAVEAGEIKWHWGHISWSNFQLFGALLITHTQTRSHAHQLQRDTTKSLHTSQSESLTNQICLLLRSNLQLFTINVETAHHSIMGEIPTKIIDIEKNHSDPSFSTTAPVSMRMRKNTRLSQHKAQYLIQQD